MCIAVLAFNLRLLFLFVLTQIYSHVQQAGQRHRRLIMKYSLHLSFAWATTFVHVTLIRCMVSWVECATQNIVLTLALLVHFVFSCMANIVRVMEFHFYINSAGTFISSANKYMKKICYIILKDDQVERVQKVMWHKIFYQNSSSWNNT